MPTEDCYRCGKRLESYFAQLCPECRAYCQEAAIPDAPAEAANPAAERDAEKGDDHVA